MAPDLGRLFPNRKGTTGPPILLQRRSSDAFIIFVVVFAVFTDVLLYGLIVPVAPTALHERVGLPVGQEQTWTSILLALYGVALLATSPAAGYIADRLESRWWPFIAGLVALGASTALLCVGTHLGLWIVGRLFQGASTAVVWTVGAAMLVDTVGKEGLGQAMGYMGMGMTLGIMGGPLLGGVIYARGGYYAVFALAFALIGVDIVLRFVMIEKKHAAKWIKHETPESPLSPPPETKEEGSDPENVVFPSGLDAPHDDPKGIATAGSPPPISSKDPASQKPKSAVLTLLASDRMVVTIWAYFIVSVMLTSFDSVLPLFVEGTFGWGQTGQGVIFIPLSIPHITDPLFGIINDKYVNARRYMAAGALFASLPLIVLLRFVTHNSMGQKVLLCALLALIGVCIASLMPPLLVEASYIVHEKEERTPNVFGKGGAMALAYGILNTAYAAGMIVGPFFAGFIRDDVGWGTMTWALGLLTGVSGVPILLFLGGSVFATEKEESADTSLGGQA
ncbi:MFS transporter [Aspergillus heteromorphus CBS 117.55]|uniref:MFS transporter n=1 Tax=Aspergillus heteromorphus CBS 117.55 TaxID=1448321 RepID=A0A317V8L2_9EURO|nr:MFS transporter [Aspergillus heteromorphus CBS 117.55]PWY68410.1 MFS transporter [Aspergillus heteromorphus CBS 117.55]